MSALTTKTKEELTKDLTGKEESLRKFRFGTSGSRSKNVREGRNLRRDIARIHTALNAAGPR